jgi:hypothetical protein
LERNSNDDGSDMIQEDDGFCGDGDAKDQMDEYSHFTILKVSHFIDP